jgi:hypothetical protein
VQISSLIIVYEYCDEQNNLLDFTTIWNKLSQGIKSLVLFLVGGKYRK